MPYYVVFGLTQIENILDLFLLDILSFSSVTKINVNRDKHLNSHSHTVFLYSQDLRSNSMSRPGGKLKLSYIHTTNALSKYSRDISSIPRRRPCFTKMSKL
jgi:hypothetical protein